MSSICIAPSLKPKRRAARRDTRPSGSPPTTARCRDTSAPSRAARSRNRAWPPAEFALDLRGVDGVAQVVAGAVDDIGDEIAARAGAPAPVRRRGRNLDVVEAICDLVDELAPRLRPRGDRSSLTSSIAPATTCATPSTRASRARTRLAARNATSRRACARRFNGISPTSRGGRRSVPAPIAASGSASTV